MTMHAVALRMIFRAEWVVRKTGALAPNETFGWKTWGRSIPLGFGHIGLTLQGMFKLHRFVAEGFSFVGLSKGLGKSASSRDMRGPAGTSLPRTRSKHPTQF